MDLSLLDILTPSEEGREYVFTHPSTGAPWRDSAGKPLCVTLLGQHSGPAQGAYASLQSRLEARPIGAPIRSRAETVADEADILVAVTRRWNFEELDGKPFPCTPDNARAFWNDPRFAWLRIRALRFIGDDGNFLGAPPTTSPSGPSDSSP